MVKATASLWRHRAATRLGGKKKKLRRPSTWREEGLHRSVLHDANTPRPVPGVVRGHRDEFCGHAAVPHGLPPQNATADVFSSGRTRGGVGFRCLAACHWRRLRCCSVIEDARQERCWDGRARPSAARRPARPLTAALTHFPPLLSLHPATAQPQAYCHRNNTHVKAWQHISQENRVAATRCGHRADKSGANAPTPRRHKKRSSTPCHVLVRDGAAFQSNTATRRAAFPQGMRAATHSRRIFLFHFRKMQQLPAPSVREASSCTATCTPCGCVSADTQIKRATHVKEQKKTQRSYRTDKEKRKKPAKAQEGTAAQPTAIHNTLAETKIKT
ncbi:hypothetical protein TCDM_08992 [Trypanosoma cruzi Dm28c]|uniref:Uncharacterized protein n=1 Tax=Trypanosoma cruzi Dm28c TaxID=1416333 RepID=V5BFL7_TRYCR|nr:hypothetical protein TCDM_08992 [Trypanosoma cruzi Dm28c]